jgi:dTDP-4-dehydrorhamnose reductase
VKILVLGASGMIGHVLLRYFAQSPGFSVVGSVRTVRERELLPQALHGQIVCGSDIEADGLAELFSRVRPNAVVNCIGVVKQAAEGRDPLAAISVNALFPHRLLRLCKLSGARLIHLSTDCVFSGAKGMYSEQDTADATDLYGRSKLLGELDDLQAVTLRKSAIGPELEGTLGLLGWFLSQRGRTKGFTRAVFSGMTTLELARVIRDFVLPRPDLHGILHVAAEPIDKYRLLCLIAQIYGLAIEIEPDDQLAVDRSLDASLFRRLTGYVAPSWPDLLRAMHQFG